MTAALLASGALVSSAPALAQSSYDAQFVSYPTYNGDDLVLTVDASGTHFRLWRQKAKEARVNL